MSSLGAGVDVDGNGKAVVELTFDVVKDDIVVTFKIADCVVVVVVVVEDEFVELSSATTYIDMKMTSNSI